MVVARSGRRCDRPSCGERSLFEAIRRVSRLLAAIDRVLLTALIAAITLLVLANVGARRQSASPLPGRMNSPSTAMIMACFVGASLMLRLAHRAERDAAARDPARACRAHPSGPDRAHRHRLCRGLLLLGCAGSGFDPAGLAAAGFDIRRFEGTTFNFIYTRDDAGDGAAGFVVLPHSCPGLR